MVTKSEHPPLVLKGCNHCGGTLEYGFDEYGQYYTCMTCGRMTELESPYRDQKARKQGQGILYLDYVGPSPAMKGIWASVLVENIPLRTREKKTYYCPLPMESKPCGADMKLSREGSGPCHRRYAGGPPEAVDIQAFKCPLGHTIQVVEGVGWF